MLFLCVCSGQERFGNMTRVYYREAMGAFIVFDVTRPTTFEAVAKWKEDLDSKLMLANGQSIATVLLANKCDQGRDVLTNNAIKMDQFCKDHGFVGWFETSAKVQSHNIPSAHSFFFCCCSFFSQFLKSNHKPKNLISKHNRTLTQYLNEKSSL